MADEAELKALKSMILSFRVSELHMLLGFAGRNKSGRKCELQARAIELLQLGSYPVILKIRNLYKSIQQGPGSSSTQDISQDTAPDGSNCDKNGERFDLGICTRNQRNNIAHRYGQQSHNREDNRTMYYGSSIYPHSYALKTSSQIPASHYPVHPDVKLKKLPFYEISAELLKPSSLVPQNSGRMQENTFVFHLTPQQATAIGLSRDLRSGSKTDYSVQGQLRFCLLETTSEQEDCFPPGIMVKVNNKICQLPNPIPTNKPGVEPKRPPRPVNITHLMKISPTVGNTVQVQWNPDYSTGYVVAVYLVHKKSWEDLLNRLKAKGVRGADYTRGMIKDKLNEDADSEIATTSLRVSLTCPLGKMRMITPCRASTCQHLQCFDASLFLQMNERKPSWMCPVCDKPALYDRLVIDGYFQEVLSSGKLSPEGNEIQLHSDGSWSSHSVKKQHSRILDHGDSNHILKIESKVETVQVDGDDVKLVPSLKKTSPSSSPKKDATAVKRKVEEIDLTQSDSDDEPLILHKKRDYSYFDEFNKFSGNLSPNRPESVISSGRNSPSLIILDSDSSSSVSNPVQSTSDTRSPSPSELLANEDTSQPPGERSLFQYESTVNFSETLPEL